MTVCLMVLRRKSRGESHGDQCGMVRFNEPEMFFCWFNNITTPNTLDNDVTK